MALFKNPATIIAESAELDLEVMAASNILTEEVTNNFLVETENIPTMEDGVLVYTEEVVPVFSYKDMAAVELDNLQKFMESSGHESVTDALNALGEHYNLDPQNICVVIESDEAIHEALEEAKKTTGFELKDRKLGVMNKATETIFGLKDAGVKLLKKPNKKKKK